MPIAPALQRFIDDELGRSPELLSRVLAGTLQSLRDARDGSSGGERSDGLELLILLQRQGERFQRRALDSLRSRIDDELANGLPDAAGGSKSAFGGLALMDESRVDIDIALSQATHAIDGVAEWELRELQTFTSALLGQHHVSAASNPFRPLLYASALWDAACEITPAAPQRALLLRHASAVAAPLLKHAWAAACSRLEELGIQPCTYRTVVLPGAGSSRTTPPPPVPTDGLGALLARLPAAVHSPSEGASDGSPSASRAARPAGAPAANTQRFEAVLQRLEDGLCASGQRSGTGDAACLDRSARLEGHRQALVASAATAQDARVIELLTRVFETIFSDPALAPPFRQVVARLQVASLRVALTDAAVMASHKHPVWLLVDRIGELSAAFRTADDPHLLATQAFCDQLADEIARTPSPHAELFKRGLGRLEGWLHEQAQAALAAAQPAIAALARTEQRAVVEQRWAEQLAASPACARATPGIQAFVATVWSRVVADAVLRAGTTSNETTAHLKTLEDLLWSVQLPDHPQSRQRLLTLLPSLLKRLQAGMDAIGVAAREQQGVLDELMQIHAEALRPGARAAGASRPMPMPAPVGQREPPGGGLPGIVIDVALMDTVPGDVLSASPAPASSAAAIDGLRPFERRRLFIQGRWHHCQLLWRSEHSHFFLFAGDTAGRIHSLTRSALDRMHSAGLLLPVQSKPLLQRAVDHLSREPEAA